jgi:type II secretory pathway pseudopilin PulG
VTETCRKNVRRVLSWFSWLMEGLRKTDEGGFTLVELLAVITFLFHKQLP